MYLSIKYVECGNVSDIFKIDGEKRPRYFNRTDKNCSNQVIAFSEIT